MDDDVIWMLPFWRISEKFIEGAMPVTPKYRTIVQQAQEFMNSNGYNIAYEPNWFTPWDDITDTEYTEYYLGANPSYNYLVNDHLETRLFNNTTDLSRFEINKMKAKLEQYFADPSMARVITHNNWGEYGHKHHVGVNKAVRELAVKYRKDVWMLGCDNGVFVDVTVPNGITWSYGSFNQPDLYTGIRTIYENIGRWTWYTDRVPSGDHKFIKIVDAGSDKSYILKGDEITYPGEAQAEPGAYIFDGDDDYMTLKGNNYPSFTISMRIRPDEIKNMDIADMAEYPGSSKYDRNLILNRDGNITARIFDGNSEVTTSSTKISAGTWSHVAITSNGTNLVLYVNGLRDKTISTGTAITNYSTPEFVLGLATETSSCFKGQINNVKFFDHALTESEIAALSGMVYTITSSAGTGGTIDPNGATKVSIGTDKTYTITPGTGYKISNVLVDNVSAGAIPTYTFNYITSDHTISATFEPTVTYTITASAATGGSINPSGAFVVNEGANQTFSIKPDLGFKVSDVKIDDISVGAVSSYTFSNVAANHSITALFDSTPTYTITATAGTGGLVSPGGILTLNEGSNQVYSITAGQGYKISDVRVDDVSAGALSSYTFSNLTANHTISATFEIITLTLTSSAGSGGSINPYGTVTVNYGTSQTFSMVPDEGYQISSVLVDNVPEGAPSSYTFNYIIASHTISASFAPRTFTITSSAGTGGSVTPSGSNTVTYGGGRTFTISANTGYNISDVKIDNVSVGAISAYTFSNVTADHTISATFSQITFTITGSAGTGGSISPSGDVSVGYGSSRTFTISPGFGYQVSDVKVDNVSVGAVTSYTFNNVTTAHTIAATFITATYSLVSSAGTGGTIDPAGTITATHGTSRSYTITPDTGYEISDVKVDNASTGKVATYTFSNITANHAISATFAVLTFTISVSSGTGGTISPNGNNIVNYGTARTFNITPNTGYHILDVKADYNSVGPVSTYTFSNVTGNHTLTATFAITTYVVTANAGAGGSINPAGVSTVDYGSNLIFTITPGTGFNISDVRVDNTSVGAVSEFTFSNVTSDHSISAAFSPIIFQIKGSSKPGGTISSPGIITVNYGTSMVYSIIPDAGYQVADVIVDNKSAGPLTEYTFNSVTENHTISASFSKIILTITSSKTTGGSISPDQAVSVEWGSNQSYTFAPDHGFKISDVKIDGISVGSVSSYNFTNITANHTISVVFTLIPSYSITAESGEGGAVSPEGRETLFEGADQTYTIIPVAGYRIQDVLVDNKSVGIVSEYTFTNVNSNHTITALFTTRIEVVTYPNPFISDFNIMILSPDGMMFDMSVADMYGKIIFVRKKVPGNSVMPVNLQVSQGFYFIRFYNNGKRVAVMKIFKS
ncbi:MAG: LamG-like jellyroll fold domain-containing protein [Bacteroidota bacterium]|nr:LamG-like jellyroll fold domain-containing protein [Bacteroidota bacterium]